MTKFTILYLCNILNVCVYVYVLKCNHFTYLVSNEHDSSQNIYISIFPLNNSFK